ncbi:MAG: glycosyl transferase [Cyclobacteriaceae bacterium]|nr:glycosyl transferase [Cyclobacteriaceae bacterium]
MNSTLFTRYQFLGPFVFCLAILVFVIGMVVPVMEIDGGVYAEISREMYRNGNFLELFLKGQDWLDKPHFQFWITALSFHLFGVSSFSYKLPAVLFMLVGVYYTFRFGKYFYTQNHGYLAALLLLTSQHTITSNSDVRAEPYLTGLTIFALYYLAVFLQERKPSQMILGALGLACLLMTKGLFTIIPVGAGLGLAMIYARDWKGILHWQWLAVVCLTLIFISPLLYGYYIQFDAQPEKVMFGNKNVSGIKFFLWDSQWGRFTNTGPIKGQGDPFFFLHTLLWAYMPWAFLAYFVLFVKAKQLIKRTSTQENYTFFGFVFLFIVFIVSRFQLPHYLNALFPYLSILTAWGILHFSSNRRFLNIFTHIQLWSAVLVLVAILLVHLVFSTQNPTVDIYLVFLVGIALTALLIKSGSTLKKIIFVPAIAILLVNYYINRSFYPQLLKYQAESELAFYMNKHGLEPEKLVTLGVREEMTSFLQDQIVPGFALDSASNTDVQGKYVFTDDAGLKYLQSIGVSYTSIQSFPDFRITVLNGTFFNKKTRNEAVQMKYLLKTAE